MRSVQQRQPTLQFQARRLGELAQAFVTRLNRCGNPGRRTYDGVIGWRVGEYGSLLSPQVRAIHRPGYVFRSDSRVGSSRCGLEEWADSEINRYTTREYVEVTDGICCWQEEREIHWWADDTVTAVSRRADELVNWWAHAFAYRLRVLQETWFASWNTVPPDDHTAARAWTAELGTATTRWMDRHLTGDAPWPSLAQQPRPRGRATAE